jgi:ABC-type transport system substrate-binding protein
VASSPYTDGSKWSAHVDWPTPNADQARALVDAWKSTHGGEVPVIRLSTPPDTDFARVAQVLQASWQGAGFEVKIEQYEQTAFTLNLVVGKFDAAIVPSFHGDDPAAEEPFITQRTITLPGFLSINFPRYGSPVVEEALKVGREATDFTTRKAAYTRIWNDYATHFPYLWLFHMRWAIVYNTRIHGVGRLTLPDGSPVRPIVWGTTMLSSMWVDK